MTDEKQRALVSGKERVARAIVWQLEIGGLRLRCVRREPDKYVVQVRVSAWESALFGTDPTILLRVIVNGSSSLSKYLERRAKDAEPAPCPDVAFAPPRSSQDGGSGPGTGET